MLVRKTILTIGLSLIAFSSFAAAVNEKQSEPSFLAKLKPPGAKIVIQGGGFSAYQGVKQDIGIIGLIGDEFTVTDHADQNVLLGAGYFLEGVTKESFQLMYGINAFYLASTSVSGNVIQEHMFNNLAYSYSVINYPIYLAAKTFIDTKNPKYKISLDLGVGPNIIKTSNFSETSLDNGVTLPDVIFRGETSVAFSATAGFGVLLNNIFGHTPLEIGYRFFYLGQGKLDTINDQVTGTFYTGHGFANALVFSVVCD